MISFKKLVCGKKAVSIGWADPEWPAMIGQTISPLYGGSSRREKDVVTPHSIAIILFIEKYAKLRLKYWDPRPSGTASVSWLEVIVK